MELEVGTGLAVVCHTLLALLTACNYTFIVWFSPLVDSISHEGKNHDIGTLSYDSGFNILARTLEPVLVCCWNGSLKLGNNKAYLVNEVELLELP